MSIQYHKFTVSIISTFVYVNANRNTQIQNYAHQGNDDPIKLQPLLKKNHFIDVQLSYNFDLIQISSW